MSPVKLPGIELGGRQSYAETSFEKGSHQQQGAASVAAKSAAESDEQ